MNGALQAEIVKDFTFFTQRYRVEGMDWEVNGNFGAHDYEDSGARGTVASIHKPVVHLGRLLRDLYFGERERAAGARGRARH